MFFEIKKIVDVQQAAQKEIDDQEVIPTLRLPENMNSWTIEKDENHFVVTGRKIERFAERTDFDSNHGVERLRDIMGKMGIMHQLRRMDVAPEQKISIGKPTIGSIQY